MFARLGRGVVRQVRFEGEMRLPVLAHPDRYVGLYVVDFGQTVSVGYTADEVAMLLESEAYRDVKVYRIYDARPDGAMELKGVPFQRFQLETGLFFYCRDLAGARREFGQIRRLAEESPLPCRAQLLLGKLADGSRAPYVVGLAYPAEHDEDVSRWMLDHDVTAGERADGGTGRLQVVRRDGRIIESEQLHADPARRARSRQEVLGSVGEPIQRTA